MLTAPVADADHVLSGALGLARLVICLLVVASFALFAVNQASGASKHQVAELNAGTPTASASSAHVGQPRAAIDAAANVLEAPFRSVIGSDNQWVQRGFATVCALLLYGVGLGYLARFSQGRA